MIFVDDQGGSLAVIAAAMSTRRGVPATAGTTVTPAVRGEVATILLEVGASAVPVSTLSGSDSAWIWVGRNREIDAWLYEGPETTEFGPTTLEKLALARIARDRCDRYLDRAPG